MFCTDCGNELHSAGESQNHRLNTLTLTKLEHKTESPSSTDSLDILAESLNSIRGNFDLFWKTITVWLFSKHFHQ